MSLQALPQADQIRLQRLAEHLVASGPRAIAECVAEALAGASLDDLMRYLRLSPDLLGAVQAVAGMSGAFPPQFVTAPDDLTATPALTPGADREVA